jgi:diaminohydroxyphosphoribosylaminopyrimidine deaminase / 5-amino-6-(5-phosphoribosylamino)uracil reductase
LNRRFFIFHTRHRPYIVLKWAQTANGKIGGGGATRVLISNEYSTRLVHKWRSEEAGILVGTNTALSDDPALTVRLWTGRNPVRLVIDKDLRLPDDLKLFDGDAKTIVFNRIRHAMEGFVVGTDEQRILVGGSQRIGASQDRKATDAGNIFYYQVAADNDLVIQLVTALYREKILSVLVEGGAVLLQSFLDAGYWDEVRVITNRDMLVAGGLAAPILEEAAVRHREELFSDSISYYRNIKAR